MEGMATSITLLLRFRNTLILELNVNNELKYSTVSVFGPVTLPHRYLIVTSTFPQRPLNVTSPLPHRYLIVTSPLPKLTCVLELIIF